MYLNCRGRAAVARSTFGLALAALTLSLILAAPPSAAQPAEEPEPALAFEAAAVLVESAAPEARYALFGVGRGLDGFISRMVRFDTVVAADEEGAARFELPGGEPVVPRSVWVAVDLVSGDLLLAAPGDGAVNRVDFPAQGLGAARRFLDGEGRYLDVLLVRPEEGPDGAEAAGVWGLRAGDGGESDRDGEANSRIALAFADLRALAESGPAPETLRPKDVLVGVDPETFEVFAVQLADAPEGE